MDTPNITIQDYEALLKQNRELRASLEAALATVAELQAQVAWLKRQMFGRKSEKSLPEDPNQRLLFEEELRQSFAEAEAESEKAMSEVPAMPAKKKASRKNRAMMEDLPVLKREVIEPEGVDLEKYKRIGEEVSRFVEFEPGKMYIREIVRPKYGLRDNTSLAPEGKSGVLIAPMPAMPVDRCIAGPSLLAETLLGKYEYHLPFYRQVQQYRHLGLRIPENTVSGWFRPAVELLKPLYEVLKTEIFKSGYVQSDETTVPVVDKERHRAAKEYLWMVRAVKERLVMFHYDTGSRSGDVIRTLAENFKGYLQSDAFGGYESAFRGNADVCLVACMAHIRRKFEQAQGENPGQAKYVLDRIRALYQVERMATESGLDDEGRRLKREELSRPIMDGLKSWMECEGTKFGPASLMGKAVTYAYGNWDKMEKYLCDGRLMIDNNLAENAIRPITLGRKNYLFCGNHEAAADMSVVCSLIATCKAHKANPRLWLNYAIATMPSMKKASSDELRQLLPDIWLKSHPEANMVTAG